MSNQSAKSWVDRGIESSVFIPVASVILILLVWEFIANSLGLVSDISAPSLVLSRIYEIVTEGEVIRGNHWTVHYRTTMIRIAAGFSVSLLLGTAVGILIGVTTFWKRVLKYYVLAGLAMPAVVAAIFATMWFGISNATPIIATCVAAVPYVAQSIYESIEDLDAELVEMARSFNLSRPRFVWRIVVQSIMPEFFGSLRFAFSVAWKITAVTEVIISTVGVGYLINVYMDILALTNLLAYLLMFTVVLLIIEYAIFSPIERYVFRYREDAGMGF